MVDIKEVAKKVIADEALAIQNLARFIDDDFEKVVRLIYNTKGRVIVTGIRWIRYVLLLLLKNTGLLIQLWIMHVIIMWLNREIKRKE